VYASDPSAVNVFTQFDPRGTWQLSPVSQFPFVTKTDTKPFPGQNSTQCDWFYYSHPQVTGTSDATGLGPNAVLGFELILQIQHNTQEPLMYGTLTIRAIGSVSYAPGADGFLHVWTFPLNCNSSVPVFADCGFYNAFNVYSVGHADAGYLWCIDGTLSISTV
jgi:hypothetical protein